MQSIEATFGAGSSSLSRSHSLSERSERSSFNGHGTMGSSRPATPESYLSSTLDHATSTIDDLTQALSNVSRVPSPEPALVLSCCCGKTAEVPCENLRNWLGFKARLESRLTLSARGLLYSFPLSWCTNDCRCRGWSGAVAET
jgi:hypothetical protein